MVSGSAHAPGKLNQFEAVREDEFRVQNLSLDENLALIGPINFKNAPASRDMDSLPTSKR